HSVQLIGRKLQKNTGVKWIADLRDLWTDVYYYPLLQHSLLSRKIDARYERKVLESANAVVSVSPNFIRAFLSKSKLLHTERFHFIPNGYDPADFNTFDHHYKPEFILTYTGTVNLQYKILPF